ncbi:MAG: DUF3006 domain-containing protein [Oscillospiraceae bacterium]|nr:DUF3006 domain-containing protein [Oscillospiraceae bacterium]
MIIIDRIDDNIAVLETDNGIQTIPADQLPEQAKDGDVLEQTENGYEIDAAATEARRQKIRNRLQNRKKG